MGISPPTVGETQHEVATNNSCVAQEATQHDIKNNSSIQHIRSVEETTETEKVAASESVAITPQPSTSCIDCKEKVFDQHLNKSPPIQIPSSAACNVPTANQAAIKNATANNLIRKKNSDLTLDCSNKSLLAAHVITLQSPEDDDGKNFESSTTSPEGEKDDLQFAYDEDEQVYSAAAATPIIAPAEMYVTAPISINQCALNVADSTPLATPTSISDQRAHKQAEELVIIDSPSATEDFDDSEFSDASLTIDEEVLYPQTLHEFSSDDEQPQPKEAEGDSSMLPTTLADNDLPEDATNVRDQDKFWHYNKLIKGPRPRVTFDVDVTHAEENPHNPIVFQDPVYDKSQPSFVQHPGRARVGEGNDITPNPGKLIKLGNDLKEVQMKMAALGDARKNKREKMRCSSRMCRLKRSANHEANKIKMSGLEQEREQLSSVIAKVKDKMNNPSASEGSYLTYLQQLKTERLQTKVAGQTGEYVNSVIETVTKPPIYCDSDSD